MMTVTPQGAYVSFAEAYRAGLAELLANGRCTPSVTDPLSIASHFGQGDRPAVELLGHRFEVFNARPSLFNSPVRRLNLPYAVGLFLWSAAGSDSVEWLSYYHGRAADFSRDNEHLCGAFGKRLLDYRAQINQIGILVTRLRSDPASRRAIGLILTPEDNLQPDLDFPCAIGIQYFLRDGFLDAVVYMRAQQALTILPYDQFIFTGFQSLVAAMLGVGIGRYVHLSGTFHFYESEREHVRELVEAGVPDSIDFGTIPAGPTPLADLIQLEADLRTAALSRNTISLNRLAEIRFRPGSFNENVRIILTAHAYAKASEAPLAFIRESQVAPSLRNLLQRQWVD